MTPRLGIALGWHCLAWPDLLDCVLRAEAHGFEVVYVDGDVSQIPSRGDADVLDGMTLTTDPNPLGNAKPFTSFELKIIYNYLTNPNARRA